jgi:signal transduction histidine kinase
MKRYFSNPEIKISSSVLALMMALMLAFTLLVLKFNYESLKESYVKSIGAVAVRVIAKDPGMESEIMPIITSKISSKESSAGKTFMQQYGLNKDTENAIFPYLNQIIFKNFAGIILIFIIMGVILFTLNYVQYGYFYDRIRNLTNGAKKVLEGKYDISICEDREGDLSKLANSFNSMRDVIRNNINDLKEEKQFLAELLSDISHQLKTPLSSLILYNDIMLSKNLNEEQQKTFLISNKNQLDKMNWLIKNLLKLAKLDAKAIKLSKENLSLNETIQDSIESLESKAYEQNIKVTFGNQDEVFFDHDRLWLEEALSNIIKNGIEHTPSGGNVNISLIENPIYKRIIIEDNGEGISEEDLPNIFKRFYKAKSSKKTDSIGIGLALAKSIIEAHGGVIEAQSRINAGTKFTITFLNY